MIDNPLLPFVLRALRETPTGLSEYELLKRIESAGAPLPSEAADSNLALFQKHFLLMNALYRLQQSLWDEEQLWLSISPLHIALIAPDAATAQTLSMGEGTALRDYYLDWQQWLATDGAAVEALLAGFWQRFHAHDGRAAALVVLQLEADADWSSIKQQYRRLAAATHPDRGGDGAQFLAIREAYEVLSAAAGSRSIPN